MDDIPTTDPNYTGIIYVERGWKKYELSNHLGNVLTVITDRRSCHGTDDEDLYYEPDIVTITDYYPFGSPMGVRTEYQEGYRFGYQGSEMSNEINGVGYVYNTEYRVLDVRLAKWFSIDPKFSNTPYESPYNSMYNNPLVGNDIKGDSLNEKFSKYIKNSNEERALIAFLNTKEGFGYLSKFAAKGQTIGDITFSEDGEYHKQGVDLTFQFLPYSPMEIYNGSWRDYPNGLTTSTLAWGFERSKITVNMNFFTKFAETPDRNDFNDLLSTQSINITDEKVIFYKLKTLVHETFIHVDQEVKTLFNLPGKADLTFGWEPDHYWENRQNNQGQPTKFATDGYNVLKQYNKANKLGMSDTDIWGIMWNFKH